MTLTRRGKVAAGVAAVLVAAGGVVAFASSGGAPAVIRRAIDTVTGRTPPPTCPLTGEEAPGGEVPDRPALAIKVENLPEARPQAGLDRADVVFEEPVEGGITRFIAVFHCRDARQVGPVRSARTTDDDVLVQFGRPILAYAGGAPAVRRDLEDSPLRLVSDLDAPDAYERVDARPAPHNLYTSTAALYRAARARGGAPEPVFTYAPQLELRSRRAREVHLPFSSYSDVRWTWSPRAGAWLRWHGDEPHRLADGSQVAAANVVVMVVRVTPGDIVDAAGNPSPEVDLLGRGRAYVFRDGRMVVGRWVREAEGDLTRFLTRDGEEIPLHPGVTWVELFPSTLEVGTAR
ncbi:MAG TPA: DUF3048 domain-containing protein [Actinomycetota bacterium]|nr:DUF3048 domain-containing protein [Actinomycetota bacterium]